MLEHIAIELPREDAQFLNAFAKEKGITVSDTIHQLVEFLHRTQTRQVNPELMSLGGILKEPPAIWDYLSKKHG